MRSESGDRVGIKFRNSAAQLGGTSLPRLYSVGKQMDVVAKSSKFQDMAKILCHPPKGSLAERVSRGLGWLSRGRQALDRSERLLHFFTALESLLSSDDKSAPVIETIARHAAVIWTTNYADRGKVSSVLKGPADAPNTGPH
jgi:hypothetical protein